MMMNSAEIVDDNMVVEGYEEIAVDDMNDMSVSRGKMGNQRKNLHSPNNMFKIGN